MGAVHSTENSYSLYSEREKLAILGLWSVPGLGPVAFARLRAWASGRLEALLNLDPTEYANVPSLGVTIAVRHRLAAIDSLEAAAERVMKNAHASLQRICFRGEPGYPERLATVEDAPPVLFVWGDVAPLRRRVGMVGSRNPTNFFVETAKRIAREVAEAGVGIVSGAAYGVDAACHAGAVEAGGETWAFVGSSLDQLDPIPWRQVTPILRSGGALFSEYPPGVRAEKANFIRRNRLISGASDATVVLRASGKSGALHTAKHALYQGRVVLAMPGEVTEPTAVGVNMLISHGMAAPVLSSEDILAAVGLKRRPGRAKPALPTAEVLSALSEEARAVYGLLARVPKDLEELAAATALSSGELTAALVELELKGLCLQHPGKVYEKI